jgi:hypothetical protein
MTHSGVDIEAPADSQVLAIADGTVTAVYTDDRYGNSVEIIHTPQFTAIDSNLSDAAISYSKEEKAAEIIFNKENVTVTVDLTEKGLSADIFKYISICAKAADAEEFDILVTLTTDKGTVEKTVTIPANALFVADSAKFIEAEGNITSIAFTFDKAAGETVYLDSFVFTPTISAAENAEIVRVGAANLNS